MSPFVDSDRERLCPGRGPDGTDEPPRADYPASLRRPSLLRFGDFELDLLRGELRRRGQPVDIHPTPFRLLCYLVAHRDRVVPKHQLLDGVWPDVAVSESALSTALKQVRRALGDDGTAQRCIVTSRRRGFRFVMDVTEEPPAREPGPVLPTRDALLCQLDAVLEEVAIGDEARTVLIVGDSGLLVRIEIAREGRS